MKLPDGKGRQTSSYVRVSTATGRVRCDRGLYNGDWRAIGSVTLGWLTYLCNRQVSVVPNLRFIGRTSPLEFHDLVRLYLTQSRVKTHRSHFFPRRQGISRVSGDRDLNSQRREPAVGLVCVLACDMNDRLQIYPGCIR